MSLYKLEEFDPNYRETFSGNDVKALELYTEGGARVGSITDALVDQDGHFRYLVIDTRFDAVGGKRILLPIGFSRINYPAKRVYIDGLSKEQVEYLPEYNEHTIIDEDYQKKVRSIYDSPMSNLIFDRETYAYHQEPSLSDLNEQYHQTLHLYEERSIANKHRIKTGELAVGKHMEIETARLTIPTEKESVMIEPTPFPEITRVVNANELKFQEGEIARIEIYAETPNIHKEAFIREEIRVRKVIERDIVTAEDIIRREELDVNTTID